MTNLKIITAAELNEQLKQQIASHTPFPEGYQQQIEEMRYDFIPLDQWELLLNSEIYEREDTEDSFEDISELSEVRVTNLSESR